VIFYIVFKPCLMVLPYLPLFQGNFQLMHRRCLCFFRWSPKSIYCLLIPEAAYRHTFCIAGHCTYWQFRPIRPEKGIHRKSFQYPGDWYSSIFFTATDIINLACTSAVLNIPYQPDVADWFIRIEDENYFWDHSYGAYQHAGISFLLMMSKFMVNYKFQNIR